MKIDFKKLVLCSLIGAAGSLFAQEAFEEELMNHQIDCTQEIAMGKHEPGCSSKSQECQSKIDDVYDRNQQSCKKSSQRRGAAKEAMDD